MGVPTAIFETGLNPPCTDLGELSGDVMLACMCDRVQSLAGQGIDRFQIPRGPSGQAYRSARSMPRYQSPALHSTAIAL
jgi:hypothetical protein